MKTIGMLLTALVFAISAPAAATEAGWALLRNGGQVVLLSHANAPGSGEPANFDVENCRTQRNLSERGRQQARRIGALFAARAEPVGKIISSRWCRCIETAQLAFPRIDIEELAALDPAAKDEEVAEDARNTVYDLIRDYTGRGNLVLMTHPDTVTMLAGVRPREGEAVIVGPANGGLHVYGRIVFN